MYLTGLLCYFGWTMVNYWILGFAWFESFGTTFTARGLLKLIWKPDAMVGKKASLLLLKGGGGGGASPFKEQKI